MIRAGLVLFLSAMAVYAADAKPVVVDFEDAVLLEPNDLANRVEQWVEKGVVFKLARAPQRSKAKGLVNRVAAPDVLDAEVESLVAAIVAKPRVAIALGKELFYRQLERGIEAAYEDAGRTMATNMMNDAALEGVQAFIDKRKPNWAA